MIVNLVIKVELKLKIVNYAYVNQSSFGGQSGPGNHKG